MRGGRGGGGVNRGGGPKDEGVEKPSGPFGSKN